MNSEENNTLKIRLRLPNGEEFEAQGPREFIERERNYFLALIRQSPTTQPLNFSPGTATPHPTLVSAGQQSFMAPGSAQPSELRLWERVFKEDANALILRQKAKLSAPELALLILAGARVLLQKEEYSALDLAHSFKACGGKGGRLDRLLTPELQAGRILAVGSKRSRTYRLTAEGFARAFTMAEKLIKSPHY